MPAHTAHDFGLVAAYARSMASGERNPGLAGETAPVAFREMAEPDLPLLHEWLNDPAVVRWWEGADVSWPGVLRRYRDERPDWIEHWIALREGEPIGWIQCYGAVEEAAGEATYWRDHLDLERTAGIDYLVSPEARGGGTGSLMIRTFVRDVVFARHPEWDVVAAGPFEANEPSWRALERAGFRRRAVLEDPEGPCVLMALERVPS